MLFYQSINHSNKTQFEKTFLQVQGSINYVTSYYISKPFLRGGGVTKIVSYWDFIENADESNISY